ncbi:MAG: hypothetical protein NVS2B16_15260 [Chloroflexota bacterium]
MNRPPDDANMLDPMAPWRTMRDAGVEAWSKAMVDLVNTDAFAQSLGAYLDNYLAVSAPLRKQMETTMNQVLAQLNMPSRSDVTGLAERLTNIEMRLDDLDAKLDSLQPGAAGGRSTSPRPMSAEER